MIKNQAIMATEFKAKCLSLLSEVERGGTSIIVTRRGRPVAVLSPAPKDAWNSPCDSWAAKAHIAGDIVTSDTSDLWDISPK